MANPPGWSGVFLRYDAGGGGLFDKAQDYYARILKLLDQYALEELRAMVEEYRVARILSLV